MDTESISPRVSGFDTWNDQDILEALWQGQAGAVAAVRAVLPVLSAAARDVTNRLEIGGRMIFVGAGTSGQIAALEAAEIPVTYGWPKDRVLCVFPGWDDAGFGVTEENSDYARNSGRKLNISAADVVIAVAASGDTPFTCALAAEAFSNGALVLALFNRADCTLQETAHHSVFLDSGSEIPAGSTRMNAGTSQKAALNLLSVLVMTRLGRVHDGMMVSMTPNSSKLRRRANLVIEKIGHCSPDRSEQFLLRAGGDIKKAILLARGCDQKEAELLLAQNGENLRSALEAVARTKDVV